MKAISTVGQFIHLNAAMFRRAVFCVTMYTWEIITIAGEFEVAEANEAADCIK